ncbi:MAG: hypothetical protein CMJ46_03940 [Planctomyces sp.]|nr:hypothetical protein [Planctomyces sp.]
MKNTLYHEIEMLLTMIKKIRLQSEQAEIYTELLRELSTEISDSGLLNQTTILGEFLLSRSYASEDFSDSAQALQAAFLVPGGIGVIFWDALEFSNIRDSREGMLKEAIQHFVPFHKLQPALQGLLLPHIRSLFDAFRRHIDVYEHRHVSE